MLKLWFFANSLLWPFNIEISGLKLGLNVIILSLVGGVWIFRKSSVSGFTARVVLGIIIFLAFSFLVATTGICTDKLQKFVFAAPVLILLVFVGLEIGWRATLSDWMQLESVAIWVLLIAFAGFLFEALMPGLFPQQESYRLAGKLSGLFAEPSHVAVSLFPSVAILLVSESVQLKRKGVLALVGLVLLSRSATLVVLIMAWLFYRLTASRKIKFNRGLLSVLVLLAVAIMVSLSNYDRVVEPVLKRVMGVVATDDPVNNISSLVYIQGWQDAWANLQRTNGMGLGFNMMGCTPLPEVPARLILDSVFHMGELNAEDGSFLFAKIVSEGGVVGVLMFSALACWLIRLEWKMRKNDYAEVSAIISMLAALIFVFVTSSLLRSTGYFGGGLLLLVVVVAGVSKLNKRVKR